MKQSQYIWLIPVIILVIVGGYALMHGSVYAVSLAGGNISTLIIYTLLIIALGLAIPYWVLKLGMKQAHMNDPQEKEVELKNIPKEQKDPKPASGK